MRAVSLVAASNVLALAGVASACGSAIVTVEASHGGAGNGLTNTTVTVPIGTVFTGDKALDTVSTLYLTGSLEAPLDSITCSPYKSTDGTGSGGLPFNSTTPSFLSTNTVEFGSIVCIKYA
ncbi:uncharacterized protein JN550_004486 [Neoarthrinium moseri]|uniref:uncharacterized protein n=1 Tax=Neoarthrinium moseri TaxID=1658444 RepID=UPI001FDB0949|nr:uncharacterized protein JN550_004486 [Neoarthrinium moseri]KAI1871492.1 hypothetical protein JN550_004486 [Neoarthrinium moseri]